jgi:hypothetical protein
MPTITVPPASTPGVQVHFLTPAGAAGAGAHNVAAFVTPYTMQLSGLSARMRGVSGAEVVATLDIAADGVSLLAAPLALTAAAVNFATLAAASSLAPPRPKIADEAALTLTLTLAGTNPEAAGLDVTLTTTRG